MNSRDYWARRARLREEQSYRAGWQLTADLYSDYETALKEIKRDVSEFYVRYAKKYGLTYEDAAKVLNRREMQEWKKTLDEYLQQIDTVSDPEVKRLLKMQLDALSYNARITRLDALAAQIDQELGRLFDKGVQQCKETFGDAFTEGYYQKHFDIQQRAGFAQEIAAISPEKIESVLSYPWSGATFSSRLWQNKQVLSYTLKNTLTQGIIRGKSIAEMTKELSDKTGASFKSAERLIRTETAHIHNEADRSAYIDADVKEYEYLCGLDECTCSVCGALDGQHFKVSDAEPGINFPTMHPNCRCTTVEYDPEDALDWQNSGEAMPERMTYEQWKEKYIKENGEGSLELARKKAYNETADQEQYQRYADRLGKEAPENFADFQKLKYEDPEGYKDLTGLYSYKGQVPEAAKEDFDIYKKVKSSGFSGVIRVPANKIDTSVLTIDAAHIAARNHDVTLEEAVDYINNAVFSIKRNISTNYYSPKGAAYVGHDGEIRTAYKRAEFTGKVEKIMEELGYGKE